MEVCSAVDYSRGRDSGYSRLGYGMALLEEVVINSTIEQPELTQDWETDSWRAQKNLVGTRTQEKGAVTPQETDPDLPVVSRSLRQRCASGLLQGRDH